MTAPRFIGSEIYRGSSYGARHPLSIPRVPTVTDLCRALGWLTDVQYITSPRARPQALTGWHTPAYIAALQRAEAEGAVTPGTRARHHLGTLSNPVFPEMFRRPATAAGGSLLATDLIAGGGTVYNPGGGTHHGMADRAAGSATSTIRCLRSRRFWRRVSPASPMSISTRITATAWLRRFTASPAC